MSNYLAISAVTTVLKYILEKGFYDQDIHGIVTIKPLHTIGSDLDATGINISLNQVTLNSGYASYDLPMRDKDGRLISKPLIGLDLHYLLTPFSTDNDELVTQQILASTMITLHEQSILTKEIIAESFKSIESINPDNKILNTDLSNQIQKVKLMYKPMTIEEITKLWSSNFQTNYRLSVAYIASVVLLQSQKEPVRPLPVQERKLFVNQYRYPMIDRIDPEVIQWDPNVTNRTIHIIGKNLNSENLKVKIGKLQIPLTLLEIPSDLITGTSDERITVNLPDAFPAGMQVVKIIHGLSDSTSLDSGHLVFESNTSIFILAPRIMTNFPIQIQEGQEIALDFKPPLEERKKIEILIGNQVFSHLLTEGQTFPFENIKINTKGFPIGRFLFRLRINGAESFLESGPDPNNPAIKKYIGPEIDVIKSGS